VTHGLAKANAYYNNNAARQDWAWLAQFATWHGYGDDVARLAPPDTAGYRTIDKRIAELRKACGYNGPLPSAQANA